MRLRNISLFFTLLNSDPSLANQQASVKTLFRLLERVTVQNPFTKIECLTLPLAPV